MSWYISKCVLFFLEVKGSDYLTVMAHQWLSLLLSTDGEMKLCLKASSSSLKCNSTTQVALWPDYPMIYERICLPSFILLISMHMFLWPMLQWLSSLSYKSGLSLGSFHKSYCSISMLLSFTMQNVYVTIDWMQAFTQANTMFCHWVSSLALEFSSFQSYHT